MLCSTIFFFCVLICPIISLKFPSKQCQDYRELDPVYHLKYDKFAGTWYDVKHYDIFWENGTSCGKSVFEKVTDTDDPDKFKIKHNYINVLSNESVSVVHEAIPQHENSGAFTLNIPSYKSKTLLVYVVVATDYENYAILWLCEQLYDNTGGAGSIQGLWIYSRKPTLEHRYQKVIDEIITKRKFTPEKLIAVDHSQKICGSSEAPIFKYSSLSIILIVLKLFMYN